MAKTDANYSKIDRSVLSNDLRQPNWLEEKEIVALDTETSSGDIFMISVSGPDYSFLIENDGKELASDKIFDTLTRKRFRGKCNVFFNLKFDASVLLKILPKEKAEQLRIVGETTFEKYEIKYIPGKFLQITNENGHKYEYFDIAQIFGDSLEGATDSWLDDGEKNEEDIDTAKFVNQKYIDDNYRKIKKYALNDAEITRQITLRLFNEAENKQNIPCGRPYSTGYLASQYLTQRLPHSIGYGPNQMQKLAWESYSGGRFEVFKRGDVSDIIGPDINSAYPANLSGLPDPASLTWAGTDTQNIDLTDIRESDYGFIRVKLWTNPNKKIQPFAVKINGKQTYPTLDGVELTVIKDTFFFALDNGYIDDFEIQKAVIGNTTNQTRYPFDFMEDKYDERKQLEDRNKYNGAGTIKIYLNSVYGKTLQTNWEVTDYDIEAEVNEDSDNSRVRIDRRTGIAYREKLRAGTWFNPFIGTYTTGLCRLQLHKTVEEMGLVDDTVMFATDCIMVDRDGYENSDFDKKIANDTQSYKEQLGKWDMDYTGKGFVIGSGVYQVEKESGGQKTTTRGFGSLEEKDLVQEAREAGSEPIENVNVRPIGFNEALHSKKLTMQDIGRFDEATKKLYPDFDSGRRWERENVTFTELLEESEGSKPVIYEG